ncbi:MAG: alpha/beta fold hydrolase [Rhizobiaceae bacterium]
MAKARRNPIADMRFADPAPLPPPDDQGYVEFQGARIWCGAYGDGPPVILLHGALGNGDDWSNQVPALVDAGHSVLLIDSRGRGRSSPGNLPLSYELMAAEVLTVMNTLDIERAAIAGWSDGAIISLILALHYPDRVDRVFAYAGNMDMTGARSEPLKTLAMDQSFGLAMDDYARLSQTPDQFRTMVSAMESLMHSQPNYRAEDLARISRPVAIVQGEFDEFIKPEHAAYLARAIPDARLITLPGVSHFAPWQDPDTFNAELIGFLQD